MRSLNYPLAKLLRKHNVFGNFENNILPKTSILDEFLTREKKLECKNIISYSLINNKIYQTYLDALKQFEPFLQNPLKQNTSEQNENKHITNVDFSETVQHILKLFENFEKLLGFLIRSLAGFNDLSLDYQTKIIKRNLIDFIIIFCLKFYENGELNVYLKNGVHTSRDLLTKLRGKFMIDLQYDALDSLYNLKITERERVVLLAFIFFLPGI